eukprot:TRINITY_DN49818_c0_g1_i1.p1 TRINITY_DN49818_c0_g1~~TRINITY_DN49818_c0_g1_i1.p1  ORF type:complete len:177 (-),score=24.10 TRINITY_DN49818_c0_g1_i1:46-540(-)
MEARLGGVLADVRMELEAASRPSGLDTPLEVIHNVFMRGKRPMAAPLSARTSTPRRGQGEELCDILAGINDREARPGSSSFDQKPSVQGSLAPPRPASWGEAPTGEAALEPPLKRAKAEKGIEEERRAAIEETPVWRSVLGYHGRDPIGAVGTMGEWLSSQGCV